MTEESFADASFLFYIHEYSYLFSKQVQIGKLTYSQCVTICDIIVVIEKTKKGRGCYGR